MAVLDPSSGSLRAGLVPLLAGLFLAALSGAVMKGLSDELPAFLIVWMRFLGFVLLMLPLVVWRHGRGAFRPVMPGAQALRGAMMAAGTACFIVAARTLEFAEAITLLYVYPFIITLLAPVFLREPPRLSTFLGVAGGFAGVLLVARPDTGGLLAAGAPFALGAGALIAGQMILNRRLGRSVDPILTSFWGACVVAALVTPAAPFLWQTPTLAQAGQLALLAVLASVSQTLHAIAFARAPAADLAPFTYAEIVAGVGIGLAVFGTWPDVLSFLGMAVIALSGIAVARVQRGRMTARRTTKI